jgi:signal transduction histidine kinase/putative methionine-R-sulfoxide reductase with GAF domain
MNTIKQIGLAMESTMSFDEVLTIAANSTTSVMQAERTTIFLTHPNGNLISRILEGDNVTEIKLKSGQGLAGWSARHGIPVLIKDAYSDERFDKSWDESTGFKTREVMCHPIMGKNGSVMGVAEVLNAQKGEFSEDDLNMLGVVCSQLALAIENSKMITDLIKKNQLITKARQDLEQRNQELDILLKMESIISRADCMETLCPNVFDHIFNMLNAQIGCLYMANSDGAQNRVFTKDRKINITLRVEPGSGFAGWVAARNQKLLLKDPSSNPIIEDSIEERLGIKLENAAIVPLNFPEKSNTSGALMVANRSDNRMFTQSDIDFLSMIAVQLSAAIDHFMERETREKDRRLATVGRLLAGVLHDLRSPMTIISGYAELMNNKCSDEESAEYLGHINNALSRIRYMATDIIAFSRGEKKLLIRATSLNEFIDKFVQEISGTFKTNNIKILVQKRTSGIINIDFEKMMRVFHNIANNAKDAMPHGGTFTIEIDRVGDKIIFSFTDTGGGIPEAIQGTLFKSFVTFGKEHGTGLGLAVVKELVEAHRGVVNFTTAKGGGTTFLVTIPV